MSDRFARMLAAAALGVALVALVLAGYAVSLGVQYRDDVRLLGETLGRLGRADGAPEVPLNRPRPLLAPDD